nr:hypothetical protein [Sphingomonas sp. Y57]
MIAMDQKRIPPVRIEEQARSAPSVPKAPVKVGEGSVGSAAVAAALLYITRR